MLLTEAVPWSSARELVDWTCHAGVTEAVRGPGVATVLPTPAPTSALTLCPGFPYIRSTRGSSYRDGFTRLDAETLRQFILFRLGHLDFSLEEHLVTRL